MSSYRSLQVLVSGAGIAGATLGCLLGRQGHEVTVVERDQAVRSSGNPVDVRSAAFDVVEDLGIAPRLAELATAVRRLVLVDGSGQQVASMRTRRSEQRELEIPRMDLCGVLVDAARREADIRFGDSITGLRADEGGVDATFERAAPARFDVVVGADGLHSAVRRLAFGPESDFMRHVGLYLATVALAEPLDRDDTVLMYNQPGAATALHPGRGLPGVAFIFRSARTVDPRDRGASARLLQDVYAHAGWRVPELLDTYLAAPDTYFDAVSRVRLSAWSRGRVTLLGDAASSVSIFGEGSSSAIAGAATLATALTQFGDDVPTALRRYEREHRATSSRGQRTARTISHLLVPATLPGLTARNLALRLTGHR
jgi:2-polyprenyl-6-methoxyphenol hydroxylase-like FAD-dependent oxidoreductase